MRKFHNQPYTIKHSQNFLRNPAKFVGLMNFSQQDFVIEIGPGHGQLTQHLLPKVRTVLAIEKDLQLINQLLAKFNQSNFILTSTDFLDYPLPSTGYKVVGNIPFAHTAEMVRKLTSVANSPQVSYLIMQYEAALKWTSQPTTQAALLLYPKFACTILTIIDRREFQPIPSVDAALLEIRQRTSPLLNNAEMALYQQFVTDMFTGSAPELFTLCKKRFGFSKTLQLQKRLGINLRCSRGALTCEQWLQLWSLVRK